MAKIKCCRICFNFISSSGCHFDIENVNWQLLCIIKIAEYESFRDVKAKGYDFAYVFPCALVWFVEADVFPEEFFVVCDLYDQRHVKHVLQMLVDDKWHHMANVHPRARGPPTRIQVKRLSFLVTIQYLVKIPQKRKFSSVISLLIVMLLV